MTPMCAAPLSDGTLLEYWVRDPGDAQAADRVEEHLFSCGPCTARLQALVSLGGGLTTLVRQGRVSGIVSRAMLNRMQRDGLTVRMYSLEPGDTVPCCVYPADDVVVTALRADLSHVEAVTLSVTSADAALLERFEQVPASRPAGEVLWATPAAVVRQLPSMRLELILSSGAEGRPELGRYILEHSASPPVG
jgi:hypothetical protein